MRHVGAGLAGERLQIGGRRGAQLATVERRQDQPVRLVFDRSEGARVGTGLRIDQAAEESQLR